MSQTAPESLPSVYSWDEASRLVSGAQPGGDCASTPVVDCVTYSYDPAGRPTGVDHFWQGCGMALMGPGGMSTLGRIIDPLASRPGRRRGHVGGTGKCKG